MTISRRRILGAFCASAGGVLMPQAFAQTAPEGPAPTTDVPGATPDAPMIPTAENPNPPGCIISDPKEKVPTQKEWWRKNYSIPPAMRNDVFWGYRVSHTPQVHNLSARMLSTLLASLKVLKEDKLFSIIESRRRFYCGKNGAYQISAEIVLSGEEHDKLAHNLMNKLQKLPTEFKKLSPKERFMEIASATLTSFRDIEYELHTNWTGEPKTMLKLLHDNKGDCKDFALARAMYALYLGMPADRVAIVFYQSGDRASQIGHANVALYDDKYGWVVVDGTGRTEPDRQAEGSTILYQNDQRVKDAMANDYMGRAVPVALITMKGACTFKSVWEYSQNGFPRFMPPEMIPQRTKAPILQQIPEEIIPAHDFGPPLMSSTVPGVPGPRVS